MTKQTLKQYEKEYWRMFWYKPTREANGQWHNEKQEKPKSFQKKEIKKKVYKKA